MNIVFKINDEVKNKMLEYYQDKKRDKVIPYVVFQAEEEDTVITLYESNKVMFQGTSADVDASMWQIMMGTTPEDKKEQEKTYNKYYNCSSIGSDEVGTGDYFGPIVVTSCYVPKEEIEYLESLGIKDSKKLDDTKILKIAKEISQRIKYKSIILSNKEYNNTHSADLNMNKIKAVLHNKVLYNIVQETKNYDYIIVDEFAKEHSYYNYLKDANPVQRGITFMTKAEDKNLAVACASIISRYIFLKEFDKLCDELHLPLVKGAGPAVDKSGEEVVEKYGKDKLEEVAKLNFKNTQRILKTLVI